jgi:hypothetical protein
MKTLGTTVLFACVIIGSSSAATLVSWTLTGAAGNEAFSPGTSASPLVTATNMTRGPGNNAPTAANSFNTSGWESAATVPPGDSTEYISFGFNVQAGATATLTSLFVGTRSTNAGPGTMGLFYSGDSFANPITVISQTAEVFISSEIALGALPALTGPVEFRWIEIGNSRADGVGVTGSTGAFRLFDYDSDPLIGVQFTGVVTQNAAIPEPGTALGLLVLLAGGICLRRRE